MLLTNELTRIIAMNIQLFRANMKKFRKGEIDRDAWLPRANFCFIAMNITIQRNHSTLSKLGLIIWIAWQTLTSCIQANRLCWLGILALLSVRNDCSISTVSSTRCFNFLFDVWFDVKVFIMNIGSSHTIY